MKRYACIGLTPCCALNHRANTISVTHRLSLRLSAIRLCEKHAHSRMSWTLKTSQRVLLHRYFSVMLPMAGNLDSHSCSALVTQHCEVDLVFAQLATAWLI